jgi:hypothetical protein
LTLTACGEGQEEGEERQLSHDYLVGYRFFGLAARVSKNAFARWAGDLGITGGAMKVFEGC